MAKEYYIYLYLFTLFSFCGWILELSFRSLQGKRIINPGFLKGPYLPIYGITAVFLSFVVFNFEKGTFLEKIFLYFIITSGVEYLTGLLLEKFLHIRLWDYSKEHCTIRGHVCLTFSFFWVVLAFSFEYLFLPASLMLYNALSFGTYVVYLGAIFMSIDFLLRLKSFLSRNRNEDIFDEQLWSDFFQIIEPLLNEPQIAGLSDFRHHRNISRFDHSLKVAWLSYIISRRFSLDHTSTVRGALLHDLFHYEWLTDGPRLHGFRHPRLCLNNSRQLFHLSKKEEDIIIKHMWPLTLLPPRYFESWIVCLVDTYCTIQDYLQGYSREYSMLSCLRKRLSL